jgi:serine/threonine protein kinase
MQEKKILSSINHPNIVRLFDVFMTKTNVYFIMEVSFEGDLARYLYQNKGRLPEKRALELFCDIVEGFRCLTQLGIIHRDIKPDNILLFEGRAKIADFGFARFLKNKDEKIQSLTPLGTPLFASP